MKRSGFTMIELIFVIVILGILAAVAIPKLAATRDDAKISTKIQEGTQFIQEASSYYTAHGVFAKVGVMSNVKLTTTATGSTDASNSDLNNTAVVFLQAIPGVGCIEFTPGVTAGTGVAGSLDGNLTVRNVSGVTNPVCLAIQKQLRDKNISSASGITHTFGGSSVEF